MAAAASRSFSDGWKMPGTIIRWRAAFHNFRPAIIWTGFTLIPRCFDERTLQFLVEIMGQDRVLLGSDYPFPLGEERVGALIRGSRLASAVKAKLLGSNAEKWLGKSEQTDSAGDSATS